jgi:putative transposase
MERRFFETQNEAELFIDVLRANTLAGKFKLHDFVVMPDHFHVLLTVDGIRALNARFNSLRAGRRDLAAAIFRSANPGQEELFGVKNIL